MYKRNPKLNVLIIVPTEVLKEQWTRELAKFGLFSVCKIEIINTVVKNIYDVDLLVLDEVHEFCSNVNIELFGCVKYKYVLGLTATLERLDGRHELLSPYMEICDTITLDEALKNGWISPYRNYKVLLDVDMKEYSEYNTRFQQLFAYFNHDFKLVMELVQNANKVKIWAKNNGKQEGAVRGYLASFMKYLKLRKSFVMSHPKKFEITNKILNHRLDKKCIVFTATVKDAEQFKNRALICHSQRKKKDNKIIIDKFNEMEIGTIVSPKSLKTGVDIKGLSVGVIMSGNSSQITNTQSIGRVCRFEEGKNAEMFTLVIRNGIDEKWFNNANKNQHYITINEKQLDIVLNGGKINNRPKHGPVDLDNRF